MTEQRAEAVPDGGRVDHYESVPVETERIIRSATIWTGAAIIAPLIGLAPLVAAGWRPADLPIDLAIAFWVGAVGAAAGLGLLIWAGCPVLGFQLVQAYRQKVPCIRIGIVLNPAGLLLAGLAVLLSPAVR